MTSAITQKTQITQVTSFRTPDGLRFGTYPAAQQHWSREKLREWFYANVPWAFRTVTPHHRNVMIDELVDRLRQDWHVSKRNEDQSIPIGRDEEITSDPDPVVDAMVDFLFAGKGSM